MYPPIIQNQEEKGTDIPGKPPAPKSDPNGRPEKADEEYTEAPADVERCVTSFMSSPEAIKKYPDAKIRKQHAYAVCTWQHKKKINKGKVNGDSKS